MNIYSDDIKEKRAKFIERNCELNQEFSCAHPQVKSKINRIYNSSFPGSVLWDMSLPNTEMIMNSWSVAVKHMWGLPHGAHSYLIEELSGTHARTMLMCRYVKFLTSIKRSIKLAVQFLFQKVRNNVNTATGKNIAYVLNATDYDNLGEIDINEFMKKVKFCQISDENRWRVNLLKEIVDLKYNVVMLSNADEEALDTDELNEILDFICTS